MREAAEKLRTSSLLQKFFQRLLGEARHLAADGCSFKVVNQDLYVELRRAGQDLKTTKLDAVWFPLLSEWLTERRADWRHDSAEVLLKDGSLAGLALALAVEQSLASFNVVMQEGTLGLEINDLVFEPLAAGFEALGLTDFIQHNLEELAGAAEGVILICGPGDQDLRLSLSSLLSLYGWHYIGDLRTSDVRRSLPALSTKDLVVTSVAASDAWEAYQGLGLLGLESAVKLRAIVLQMFLPRICASCATEQRWSPEQLGLLHPALRSVQPTKGRIGTGCQVCSGTGIKGKIGIQSFLRVDQDYFGRPDNKADLSLLRQFFDGGLRPLLVDGLKKAQAGLVAFDQVVSYCPVLSADFQRIYVERGRVNSVAVPASLVEQRGCICPSISEELAEEGGRGSSSDGPLFTVSRGGRVRKAPLLLVVEDDLDQRQILELVFNSAGFSVMLAADGQEAWQQVEIEIPDLVVTDLMMPVMDGITLLQRLKADSRFKDIPVLVLTVVSDVDKEYELLAAGADDYCEKSVQRKILLKRIENLLRRSGATVSKAT